MEVKHISWLLSNMCRPRVELFGKSRDMHSLKKMHREPRESSTPEILSDEIPESNDFTHYLDEVRAPIRTCVDPRDIYLA